MIYIINRMEEKAKTVMYFYYDKSGNKLWTSNETLAINKAKDYDSEVYKVEFDAPKPELK